MVSPPCRGTLTPLGPRGGGGAVAVALHAASLPWQSRMQRWSYWAAFFFFLAATILTTSAVSPLAVTTTLASLATSTNLADAPASAAAFFPLPSTFSNFV